MLCANLIFETTLLDSYSRDVQITHFTGPLVVNYAVELLIGHIIVLFLSKCHT